MNVFLIRHTRVENDSSICYGQSDVKLAESYKEEFATLKEKLSGQTFDACISSPLSRCAQLASDLCGGMSTTDDRLMEMNFGAWEMKKWEEIDQKALRGWTDDFVNASCPEGESFVELFERCSSFWNDLKKSKHQNICIITHGGAIRSILANILSIPLEKAFVIKPDFGSISKIVVHDGFESVEYINL
jgi:alpha-ribazole phosphatase